MENDELAANTIERLKDIAEEILEVRRTLRLGSTTLSPLNYQEEVDRFFASGTYNPQYIYRKIELPRIDNTLKKLLRSVKRLELPADLYDHIEEYLHNLNMLYLTKTSVGKRNFSLYADNLFDWGTDRLDVMLASPPDIQLPHESEHVLQDAETIKQRFEQVLADYDIEGFSVNINTFTPHIISVGYDKVEIGTAIKRYKCNVDRLIVHEIESHVMQHVNIKRARNPLLGLSKHGNTTIYSEGLGVYNEIKSGTITEDAFHTYLARIKAVRLLHKSFREIYNELVDELGPSKAYILTYRVKRGMSNTELPGGFPKDACYLLGYHEIDSLTRKGFDKKHLYLTKSPVLTKLLLKYRLIEENTLLLPHFLR